MSPFTAPDPKLAQRCEQELMAALLVDPGQALQRMQEHVDVQDFTSRDAAAVYRLVRERLAGGQPCDFSSICIAAQQAGTPLDTEALTQSIALFCTMECVEPDADYVHSAAVWRATVKIGEGLQMGSLTAAQAAEQIALLGSTGASTVHEPMDAANRFFDWYNEICTQKTQPFLPTGYPKLDELLGGGMMKGGMYTFAARPGMGKTTVALNIADRIALAGHSVLYVSLEMTEVQLWLRRISRMCRIPFTEISQGKRSSEQDVRAITEASAKLVKGAKLRILDRPSSVEEIAEEAYRRPTELIVVDHMGLLKSEPGGSIYESTTENSHKLKRLALTLNIPVLCLCQMNRESIRRDAQHPSLTDLKQSGAIEEDSDAVCFLLRDAEDQRLVQTMGFVVGKNRHGNTGTVMMDFVGATANILEGRDTKR